MLAHFIQQSNLLYFTFLVCLGSALQYSKGLTEGLLSLQELVHEPNLFWDMYRLLRL